MTATEKLPSDGSEANSHTPKKSTFASFSSGDDFYDHGYTEAELNAADLPSAFPAGSDTGDGDRLFDNADCSGQHDRKIGGGNATVDNFFGRRSELERLRLARDRIIFRRGRCVQHSSQHTSDNNRPNSHSTPDYPAVLVWGVSGSGKTCLVDRFLKDSCCTQRCGAVDGYCARSEFDHGVRHQAAPSSPSIRCSCCYILRGKYDEYTGSSNPFFAIVQALNGFASQLEHGPAEELDRIRSSVRLAFGGTDGIHESPSRMTESSTSQSQHDALDANYCSVLSTLVSVVPSLALLLEQNRSTGSARMNEPASSCGSRETTPYAHRLASEHGSIAVASVNKLQHPSSDPAPSSETTQQVWNRVQYILIQFVKAISTPARPVYLFLDDLQWSSSAGLQLLATLISDPNLHSFMLLGVIRQETDPRNGRPVELIPDDPLYSSFFERLPDQHPPHIIFKEQLNSHSSQLRSDPGESGNKRLEQLVIGNLTLQETTLWLSRLLDRGDVDNSEAGDGDGDNFALLVQRIYETTRGNIFFAQQVIEQLKRCNVLVFSRITFQWEWNTEQLAQGLNGSMNAGESMIHSPTGQNVVAIIESQLRRLPSDLQYVLAVAAYIRSTVDLDVLFLVLKFLEQQPDDAIHHATATTWSDEEAVMTVIEPAMREGLIIKDDDGSNRSTLRFAHDRVQQAAYDLIPYGEARSKLRFRVGRCLLNMYRTSQSVHVDEICHSRASCGKTGISNGPIQDDYLLFAAVDHLNSAPTKDRLSSVEMNFDVGRKALQLGAMAQAAMYLRRAATAMKRVRNPWTEHYNLTLQLTRFRCEAELSLGHFEIGYKLGNEVVSKARLLDEKLETLMSLSLALGREDKFAESLAISLNVSRSLGAFPQRFYTMHIIRDMGKIKRYLSKHSNENILALPLIADRRTVMAMRFIIQVSVRSYITGDSIQWVVAACKLVRMTFKHGICQESAMAFSNLAMLIGATSDDHALSVRCADLSHSIFERTLAKAYAGWVFMTTNSHTYAFSRSPDSVLLAFQQGFSLSMEAGEFETGLINAQNYYIMAYECGQGLLQLSETVQTTLQQYKMYRVSAMVHSAVAFSQFFDCLIGRQTIDWDDIEVKSRRDLKKDGPSTSETYEMASSYFTMSVLAMLFRRHSLAIRLSKTNALLIGHDKSFVQTVFRAMPMGVASAAMYRETGDTCHLKSLRRHIKTVRTVTRKKGRNSMFHWLLLRAEDIASTRAIKICSHGVLLKTKEAYDAAILAAKDASCNQHAALAYELAGEFLARANAMLNGVTRLNQDQRRACKLATPTLIKKYFRCAMKYYKEWGSEVKVKDIRERLASLSF